MLFTEHISSFLIFSLNFFPKQKQDLKAFLFLQEGINNLLLHVPLGTQQPESNYPCLLKKKPILLFAGLESESSVCGMPSVNCVHQHPALPWELFNSEVIEIKDVTPMSPLSLLFCFGHSLGFCCCCSCHSFHRYKKSSQKNKKFLTMDHRDYLYTLYDKDNVWAKFLSESLQGVMNIID